MKKLTYLALMGLTCVLVACGGNVETEVTEETPAVTDTTAVEVIETLTDTTVVAE